MIKRILPGLFLLLASYIVSADEIVELYVGEIKILNVTNVKRVAVGNAKLLSTSLLTNGQLILIGEGEGNSNLHIWFNNGDESDYTVRINKDYGTLAQRADEVRILLSALRGLDIKTVGKRIILTGSIDESYAPAIETVKSAFPEIMDLTRKDLLELSENKMVFMNIKITEFNKNFLENLGINWDSTIAGPAAGIAVDAASNDIFRVETGAVSFGDVLPRAADHPLGYFGIATEITSRINFAVNSGNALILAEPRLATRSGGEASFLAGGEIPLKVTNSLGSSNVEFKEFGISLTLKPKVDNNNNIQANVSTEVSAVDNSVAVEGIPGFLTRKTSTDISMRSGETLVISGLINQQASQDISGLKFLSDLPILGPLFRSKTFRDNKSELVIFVTPTVFDANSAINQAELQRRADGIQSFRESIKDKSLEIIE